MDFENCNFNTDRLSIRPLNFSDYDSWFLGFSERKKSQYRHDKGRINLSDKDKKWFNNLVKKHRELFENDEIYIFSIFDKNGSII